MPAAPRALASTAVLLLMVAGVGSAVPCDPQIVLGDSTGARPVVPAPSRTACWSQPPNIDGLAILCMRFEPLGIDAELADDLILSSNAVLTHARWWGAFWCGVDPGEIRAFCLRFFEDDAGFPGSLVSEIVVPDNCNQTFYAQGSFNVYQYDVDLDVPVTGGVRYWFCPQACDVVFPPSWGRFEALLPIDYEGAFRSAYFGFPDWVRVYDAAGVHLDGSFELECEEATAARVTTWGAVRALFR